MKASEKLHLQPHRIESYQQVLTKYNESTNSMQSSSTLVYGSQLITAYKHKLGSGLPSVLEKVYLAALSYGQKEWATYCYKQLEKLYPKAESNRMRRLSIMASEAVGDWNIALHQYKILLKAAPEDEITRKRIISIYIMQKKYADAIDLMNSHLEDFSSDVETWQELAELYILQCWIDRAIFCLEEIILMNPENLYALVTLGELYASLGDITTSRKYYCLALYVDPVCLRALWGLVLGLHEVLVDKAKPGLKGVKAAVHDEVLVNLYKKSIERLKGVYNTESQGCGTASKGWSSNVFGYLQCMQLKES